MTYPSDGIRLMQQPEPPLLAQVMHHDAICPVDFTVGGVDSTAQSRLHGC